MNIEGAKDIDRKESDKDRTCQSKTASTKADESKKRNFLSIEISRGRTCLPKFRFSANFPIGLHIIVQIQMKKFKNAQYLRWKNMYATVA